MVGAVAAVVAGAAVGKLLWSRWMSCITAARSAHGLFNWSTPPATMYAVAAVAWEWGSKAGVHNEWHAVACKSKSAWWNVCAGWPHGAHAGWRAALTPCTTKESVVKSECTSLTGPRADCHGSPGWFSARLLTRVAQCDAIEKGDSTRTVCVCACVCGGGRAGCVCRVCVCAFWGRGTVVFSNAPGRRPAACAAAGRSAC